MFSAGFMIWSLRKLNSAHLFARSQYQSSQKHRNNPFKSTIFPLAQPMLCLISFSCCEYCSKLFWHFSGLPSRRKINFSLLLFWFHTICLSTSPRHFSGLCFTSPFVVARRDQVGISNRTSQHIGFEWAELHTWCMILFNSFHKVRKQTKKCWTKSRKLAYNDAGIQHRHNEKLHHRLPSLVV